MTKFVEHSTALVESEKIGENTKILAYTHILSGAIIGSDCIICDHVFIENNVVIGDRVSIKCGVQIWDGVRIEHDVSIGPNATFCDELSPRSMERAEELSITLVQSGALIGANATILAGSSIGRNAMVGTGAVVTTDVPPNAIVVGNPARITGYVSTATAVENGAQSVYAQSSGKAGESTIPGVQFYNLPVIPDMRGALSFAEIGQYLPFAPQRYFLIFDVPSREIRGEHAHKECHQFLVCVKGTCSVMVDDGKVREEYLLDSPGVGLHIPPMVWGVQYKYSSDAVLMVLASAVYDSEDYIRNYEQFLALVNEQ